VNCTRLIFALLLIGFKTFSYAEIALTAEERVWLSEHQIVRVANENDWPPFDFVDEEKPSGYSIDLIAKAMNLLGVQVEFVNGMSWVELLAAFEAGDIDILPAVYKTADRERYMTFTSGYYSQPTVLIAHKDNIGVETLNDLRGKRVGVIPGFVITQVIEAQYPDIEPVEVEGVLEGINAVSLGEVDAFVESIGLVSWYLNNNYFPNIRIIQNIDIDGLEAPKLHMAVAKTAPQLKSLVEKTLKAIPPHELKALREKWISIDPVQEDRGSNFWGIAFQIMGIGVVFFILLFSASRLFSKFFSGETAVLPFGTLQFRLVTFASLSLFIAVVSVLAWMSMAMVKKNTINDIELNLKLVLKSTVERLDFWVYQKKLFMERIALEPELGWLTVRVIDSYKYRDIFTYKKDLDHLTTYMDNRWGNMGVRDMFVLDTAGRTLYSDDFSSLGDSITLTHYQKEQFRRCLRGNTIYGQPTHPDSNSFASGIYFFSPIYDLEHNLVGVLGQSIDHEGDFANLFKLTRAALSDKVYAFDSHGRLLSPVSTDDELKALGLLEDDQTSVLHTIVRDPGRDIRKTSFEGNTGKLPLTRFVQRAISKEPGLDHAGSRDFRGVKVVGGWVWLDNLNLAIAIELDHNEAFSTYYATRNTVIAVLAITLLISVLATLFVLALGERSNKSLVKAKELLEQRVRERTSELRTKQVALKEAYEIIKVQKERMEGELNVGRDIQMSMLPLIFPAFPHRSEFDVFALLEPAREVGGDFYDFYLLDEDQVCFVIGDVSGKGVPSALFMAVTKTLIKSKASECRSPARILEQVNREISTDNSSSMFVTLFLCILNLKTGELTFTNAGHNPPYLMLSGKLKRLENRHGPIVGAVEDLVYKEDTIILKSGDMLLLYTDGVTEAMNVDQQLYSEARLIKVLKDQKPGDAKEVVGSILTSVQTYAGEADQADDITILCVNFFGVTAHDESDRYSLKIKNDVKEIVNVNQQFSVFSGRYRKLSKLVSKVKVINDDMLNNIINYAFEDTNEHEIEINVNLSDKCLKIEFIDDGIAFNPFSQQKDIDISQSIESRSIGGLGIHLIKNLVETHDYLRKEGLNIITLTMKV